MRRIVLTLLYDDYKYIFQVKASASEISTAISELRMKLNKDAMTWQPFYVGIAAAGGRVVIGIIDGDKDPVAGFDFRRIFDMEMNPSRAEAWIEFVKVLVRTACALKNLETIPPSAKQPRLPPAGKKDPKSLNNEHHIKITATFEGKSGFVEKRTLWGKTSEDTFSLIEAVYAINSDYLVTGSVERKRTYIKETMNELLYPADENKKVFLKTEQQREKMRADITHALEALHNHQYVMGDETCHGIAHCDVRLPNVLVRVNDVATLPVPKGWRMEEDGSNVTFVLCDFEYVRGADVNMDGTPGIGQGDRIKGYPFDDNGNGERMLARVWDIRALDMMCNQ